MRISRLKPILPIHTELKAILIEAIRSSHHTLTISDQQTNTVTLLDNLIVQLAPSALPNTSRPLQSHKLTMATGSTGERFKYPDDECLPAYTKALEKGKTLHTQIHSDKPSIPPSEFQSVSDLEDWGFVPNAETEPRIGIGCKARHEVEAVRNSETFLPADAYFLNTMYSETGTIKGVHNYTSYAVASGLVKLKAQPVRPSVSLLRKLCHWSDMAYLKWLHIARNQSPTPILRTVVHYGDSDEAEMVVQHIVSGLPLGEYQRGHYLEYTFDADSDEGLTMLGTPEGAGTAYLLVQHREALGHRVVDKIEVSQHANVESRHLQIVFHITGAEKVDGHVM